MNPEQISQENKSKLIENPEHARLLAESTKVLRDSAATLRSKAKKRGHEGMNVGKTRVNYEYVRDAYQRKAETLDRMAELIQTDATATMELIENEDDSTKIKILLQYQLLSAKAVSSIYAFFKHIDDLTPEDLDYQRLQKEAEAAIEEQEKRRVEKNKYYISRPPKFLLRMAGFSEEEIEQWI
ncbi:MAG: hypothetical protein A3G49_00395 [Candidatus Sungbacteria bacterium RIFCSPLOWO2_12_FULL_41_11]|uniref:Uncharacterized protein n=1 Tax=Candidatus Sungbacteria bacterium RIFCSPLOWO2_12_FULL_41_11 TaxID=1802286 RepID=A0A1G2LPF3_9BACT|nr:MAG: hypothetical protein UV01_C0002G0108 [Parcubacteria group bacterium GW2011_GWA2_42_14]OGZ99880.1 MAG: hypothetical protein A3D41_00925 [Candidatus Sungbacteria bacterium RIFCSPHIGHO2_02_FULL_41_12b]OHA12769.1 MAG: hypothetical protein A3G49_00395 [Candidatus Sungbacteria bacterium RIFCSPLOWO2_12_FULL_41_11]